MEPDLSLTDVADPSEARDVLAEAFHADPSMRFIEPDDARRRIRLAGYFDHLVRRAQRRGRVVLSPGGQAAAVWLPPGVRPTVVRRPPETLAMMRIFGRTIHRAALVDNRMIANRPRSRSWYLYFLGVRPSHQGQGWGTWLLREGLAVADAAAQDCWLETQKPESVRLYRRVGFDVHHEYDVPFGGPHFWGMLRPASSPAPSEDPSR